MVLRARKLRNKITIQQLTESIDSVGEPIQSWATYAVRSAEIINSGGRENFRYQQYFSEASILFKLRHDDISQGVTTKMRVSYDSKTFDIQAVNNSNEMNREIILSCREFT